MRPVTTRPARSSTRTPKGDDSAAEERSAARRQRIVLAATTLFSRYGFRRTSMDQLAAEAAVAKPTLYAYFRDKEAVFRAVSEAVIGHMLAGAKGAAEADGPLEGRLAGVLSAKFTEMFELVHSSPHAAEILDAQSRLGADVEAKADRAFERLLAGLVGEGVTTGELDLQRAGLSTGAFVALLLRAGHGAAYGATTAAQHRRALGELVRVLVAGVRAR